MIIPETADAARRVPDEEQHALSLEHLWLADVIARRFRGRGEDEDDLRQVARCALVEAARRYDPAQGPFPAYAGPSISGVLKRHFRDHAWSVRPPRPIQQLAVRITQDWPTVAQERGTIPSDRDLAASLEEPLAAIREAHTASQGYRPVSLEGASAAAGAASDDPAFERSEARMVIAQVWRGLTADERRLLRMRFWENRSQSDIAVIIGTSQMQVSRLLARVLDRIRRHLEAVPIAV